MKVVMLLGGLLISCFIQAQTRIIKGVVSDSYTREYLPSASVSIKGSGMGVITNANGSFTIPVPVSKNKTILIISYSGYETDTAEIGSSRNNFLIFLIPLVNNLHDVVVTTGVSRATSVKENPVPVVVI